MTVWITLLLVLSSQLPAHADDGAVADAAAANPIVINEIHYDPSPAARTLEYVELFNPGGQVVGLAGWRLEDGVDYTFPSDATIAAHGFLVVAMDPAAVRATYGAAAVGPLQGRLSNDGDTLLLRNERAQEIDRVDYGVGFPWPVTGYTADYSINLINSAADNELAGAWRAAPPTPGAGNAGLTDNTPPFVQAVEHQPAAPRSSDAVTIRARVTDSDGVGAVTLWLQVVKPGAYIRITDAAYATTWTPYSMQAADSQLYVVTLPAAVVQNRTLLRYRIEATDGVGRRVMMPAPDDPQPNFALFVYDGASPWAAAINPWPGAPTGVYDFNQMRALPTYHLIADNLDVLNAQFLPGTTFFEGYMGSEYRWRGTLVYDGVVYDHVGFRARGQFFRYATGKNKWKFNFLPGHRFQAKDNYGRPYPVEWDKLNLAGGMQHANRGYRGEHGLFEALSARVFSMAGVPSPATQFVDFRVVDQSYESSPNQYDTDFWGLYLAVEEIDGRFLDARGLPDGNVYKMNDGTGELQNQGLGQVSDKSDLYGFMQTYTRFTLDSAWWRTAFDVDNYFHFRAALEAVHHYDVDEGKNYDYYRNPVTNQWSIWPWDLDLTWADTFYGYGNEPFRDRVLTQPAFAIEYQNVLRETRDLVFNPEQMGLLIDEMVAIIDTPSDGLSMVDADRAMWDFNPILESKYVIENRGRKNAFYRQAPTRNFVGMVQLMKEWAFNRSTWIDLTFLSDRDHPDMPTLRYTGRAGFPADDLTFAPGAFSDPQGANTFAGMQWMASQVAWPGLPGYVAGAPNRYEEENAWKSSVFGAFTPTFTAPVGICAVGTTCRVRVRMLDSSGRWSHWSLPQQFVVAGPTQSAINTLQITEIMYNPPDWGNTPGDELEFIEIKNTGTTPVNLENMRLSNAVDYTFPIGTRLASGAFVLLAENAARFQARYRLAAQGQYSGQLSNGGETLELRDAFDRILTSITYDDKHGWPTYADGIGFSLTTTDPDALADPNQPEHWRASTVAGGSPGADDPTPILLNEFLFDSATKQLLAIELYNPAPHAVDVGGWVMSERQSGAPAYASKPANAAQITGSAVIAANGYLVIPLSQLSQPLAFGAGPGAITLSAVAAEGWFTGYTHTVTTFAPAFADSLGRYVTPDGDVVYVPQASTPGAANGAPATGPVTLTKVQLLPDAASAAQWVELTNLTDTPVALYDPLDPTRTWLIEGLAFQFPPGLTLPAYGRVLAANLLPQTLCTRGAAPPGWFATGMVALGLRQNGGELRLLMPQSSDSAGNSAYLLADVIRYDSSDRLQMTPSATYWQRAADDAPGVGRADWQAAIEPLVAGDGVDDGPVSLCSFDVYRNEEGAVQIEWVARSLQPDQHFALWRAPTFDRSRAELVIEDGQMADVQTAPSPEMAAFRWVDNTIPVDARPFYWLQVISDGGKADVAVAGVRLPSHLIFQPFVAQR